MTHRAIIRTAMFLVAALVAAIVGVTLGSRGNGGEEVRVPPPPGVGGAADAAQREMSAPDGTTPSSRLDPPSGANLQAPSGSAPSIPGQDQAWGLIDETRDEAGDNTGDQSELLEARLSKLPADQIEAFERVRHALDERLYSWDVWGAAYVIEDGCSDDCFRDFRAYLISLGRDAVEKALRDPDSLASVVEDPEEGDWENADDVAPDAYEEVTGKEIPVGDSDLSGEPSGEPFDDDDEDALVARYPQLAERFR